MGLFFNYWATDLVAIFISLVVITISYFQYAYTYWKRRNVPYLTPKFPTGNSSDIFSVTSTLGSLTSDFYYDLKKQGHKFGGIYTITTPRLVLVDPEYIKDICQKDFQYFVDRGVYYYEPISSHLFNTSEEKWKKLRMKLTPTFTSGKMKMMFNMIVEVSEFMKEVLDKSADQNSDIDIREVLSSFTTDVIGACAFGLNCNSLKQEDAEFRYMGKRIFKPKLRSLLTANLPTLAKALGITQVEEVVKSFFYRTVKDTIKYRKENNVTRPDFLQLLIDLYEADSGNFTLDDVVAQVFVFFVAGFDTSSATMNFALFELARNEELQERARKEINQVLENHGGKLTYESISEMKYLQQIVDETLRLYPALTTLTRKCIQDYKLRDTDTVIEKGTSILIPVYGLQRDPEYYEDPEKFDPERFSPENKNSRHPFVHLPFGEGPRNCIGLRFGLMQSKIGLTQILTNYKLTVSESSKLPLTINKKIFLIRSNETLYLKAQKI